MDERRALSILGMVLGGPLAVLFVLNAIALSDTATAAKPRMRRLSPPTELVPGPGGTFYDREAGLPASWLLPESSLGPRWRLRQAGRFGKSSVAPRRIRTKVLLRCCHSEQIDSPAVRTRHECRSHGRHRQEHGRQARRGLWTGHRRRQELGRRDGETGGRRRPGPVWASPRKRRRRGRHRPAKSRKLGGDDPGERRGQALYGRRHRACARLVCWSPGPFLLIQAD